VTPRADPSPLPPGVLLAREPPVGARRRRPVPAQRTLFVTAVPALDETEAATAAAEARTAFAPEQLPFEFGGDQPEPAPAPAPAVWGRHPGPLGPPEQLPFEFTPPETPPAAAVAPLREGPGPSADVAPAPQATVAGAPPEGAAVATGDAGDAANGPADEETGAEADAAPRPRWRTVAQLTAWAAAVVAVAVVLLVFVFPTRTYLAQRHQLAAAAGELRLLDTQNSQLAAQVARLRTDKEIERIAREQYHLVRPGESAIAILPPPAPPAPATPSAPPPAKPGQGWLHRLTSWVP